MKRVRLSHTIDKPSHDPGIHGDLFSGKYPRLFHAFVKSAADSNQGVIIPPPGEKCGLMEMAMFLI